MPGFFEPILTSDGKLYREVLWVDKIKAQIQLGLMSERIIPFDVSDQMSPAEFKIAFDYMTEYRRQQNEAMEKKIAEIQAGANKKSSSGKKRR